MARCSTLTVAIIASALCLHTTLAYPTSVERVSGDNNYLPLRNSPSRDLDRFIEKFCNDDRECKILNDMVAAAVGMTLDRLNSVHVMAAKRSSLDRLNGGHVMSAKRSSLDRLNGGHVMGAKRSSLDRLIGGHVMAAKRSSLDRLNGGHVMSAKRSHPERRSDGGVAAPVAGGPLSARGRLQQWAPRQAQRQSAPTLNRWPETGAQPHDGGDDRDEYYATDDDADGCLGCGSWADASSF